MIKPLLLIMLPQIVLKMGKIFYKNEKNVKYFSY